MRAWSDRPCGPVADVREVAERGTTIATDNGESTVVYESRRFPGWLVKLYRPGFPKEPDEALDRLIELPAELGPADRALVDRSVCWPACRLVEGGRTVGVLLAKAPPRFSAPMRRLDGEVSVPLEIDHLVQLSNAWYRQRGWTPPTVAERLLVARNLAAVATLFERNDVVYGDWSYANAFWARDSGDVFVIDADAAAFGSRTPLQSPGWEDPLAAAGVRLEATADRYKLALVVLRCLTGVRGDDLEVALLALDARWRNGKLGPLLEQALTTSQAATRPTAAELFAVLDQEAPHRPAEPASGPAASLPSTARSAAPPSRRQVAWDDDEEISPDRALVPMIVVCVAVLVLLAVGAIVLSAR